MNFFSVLWRLLTPGTISAFAAKLAKVEGDQTQVVKDFLALTAAAADFATALQAELSKLSTGLVVKFMAVVTAAAKFGQSAQKENADLAPIVKMLEQL